MMPAMQTVSAIRSAFLDYFQQQGHLVLPSSALVPHNDPTLMFSNAGMNQFKNVFTGAEKPPSPPRAATSQKCVRAGGKHNDLDNVGYTARHHTFFEMLGNFSFGDYFKEQAILHAWELLTKVFGLPADKLYFTVYHTDDEAFALWKKITGCADARILRVPTNDNFWSMGDVGPCGPCSEIFYDHGAGLSGQWALDASGHDLFDARFVEIWNLVFMQYDQRGADDRVSLPKPCVDTGMGLERMATVLQGVQSNYDIDLFAALIADIKAYSNTQETTASHKVIADHLRACSFLIADGVLPSNEGRGYVLRRIMRRAMRHAHMLGCKDPLMHQLVPSLVMQMGAHYGELGRAQPLITETLKQEEERFKEMLERGLKLLDEAIAPLQSTQGMLAGDVAFKLYDTYGFPQDLTEDILRGHGLRLDVAGFDAAMQAQKERARAAWKGSGEQAVQSLWFEQRDTHGATCFVGYDALEAEAQILAIIKDGAAVESVNDGEKAIILTDQTPFYGESGGQVGDVGMLAAKGGNAKAQITDTTKPIAELHAHHVSIQQGTLKIGDVVTLQVDTAHRRAVRAHHSATHLLHAALREVLGEHVTQKGSLVEANRLRFDFSHNKAVSAEEIAEITARVNAQIWQNDKVRTQQMDKDDAIAQGAMAMFGEKYDEQVRVLFMGEKHEQKPFSVELCGGTHVSALGEIGLLHVVSESAVAAGVRRIEAVAGAAAYAYLAQREVLLKEAAQQCVVTPEELPSKIAALQTDRKQLEKALSDAKKQLAMGGGTGAVGDKPAIERIGDVPLLAKTFTDLPPKELKDIANGFAKAHPDALIAVAASYEGKASVILLSANPIAGVDAGALIQVAIPVVGGKGGGGKPQFAQCGGADGSKCEAALQAIKAALGAKQ
jgi:alanyl-tRNA synthetase